MPPAPRRRPPPTIGTCRHCQQQLPIWGRGLCRSHYENHAIRNRYPRLVPRTDWTAKMRNQLVSLIRSGKTHKEAAKAMGLTRPQVSCAADRFGIIVKPKTKADVIASIVADCRPGRSDVAVAAKFNVGIHVVQRARTKSGKPGGMTRQQSGQRAGKFARNRGCRCFNCNKLCPTTRPDAIGWKSRVDTVYPFVKQVMCGSCHRDHGFVETIPLEES